MTTINALAVMPQKTMIPSDHEMIVFQTMAKQAAQSKLYRSIGDEFAVMTIMLAARELDIPPMAALNGGINIINGKTEISARMMTALIMKRGHRIEIIESTFEKCVLKGIRQSADGPHEHTESFTLEEAKQAGLIKDGGGWKKWPKDMCYARCISRLARRHFADIIGMGYIEGEIREKETCATIEHPGESISLYVGPESIEVAEETENRLLENFLSQFDPEECKGWHEYICQLQNKLNLTVQQIVDKFRESPEKAIEKFKIWLSKREKKNE
jgi:hypothetical protein